jgi:hypothetical protein
LAQPIWRKASAAKAANPSFISISFAVYVGAIERGCKIAAGRPRLINQLDRTDQFGIGTLRVNAPTHSFGFSGPKLA